MKHLLPAIWAYILETWVRIKEKAPGYFVKLRYGFVTICGLCITAQPYIVDVFNKLTKAGIFPESWLEKATGYVLAGAAMGTLMTYLPVKDYAAVEKVKEETKTS